MTDIINQQPASASARFGMSACGRAFGEVIGRHSGIATLVVRDRMAKTQGHLGFAVPAYVLGTTAWSPPTS